MSRSSPTSLFVGVAAAAVLTGAVWLANHIHKMDTRLAAAEARLADLEPLRAVVARARPAEPTEGMPYSAMQATGAPDVALPGMDSPRAWCPAALDERGAWLRLGYATPVSAARIRIHATHNPGGIVRVIGYLGQSESRTLWEGVSGGEAVFDIPLEPPVQLDAVRLEFNLHESPAWREIDAVALIAPDGTAHWAASASASSEWSAP